MRFRFRATMLGNACHRVPALPMTCQQWIQRTAAHDRLRERLLVQERAEAPERPRGPAQEAQAHRPARMRVSGFLQAPVTAYGDDRDAHRRSPGLAPQAERTGPGTGVGIGAVSRPPQDDGAGGCRAQGARVVFDDVDDGGSGAALPICLVARSHLNVGRRLDPPASFEPRARWSAMTAGKSG
jgi:hypothetical protein